MRCMAVATGRDGIRRQCRRNGRGNPRLCYQHFKKEIVEIHREPAEEPAQRPSIPELPRRMRVSTEELCREREAALERIRRAEERRAAEYRPTRHREKVRFGGTVRVGTARYRDHDDGDSYVPPRDWG